MIRRPPRSTLLPDTTLVRSSREGQRTLRPEPLKLAAIVETSVAAMQHQLSEARAKINLKIHVPLIVSDRLSDRKSTRLNSSHANISYAVFCLKKTTNYYMSQ